MVKMVNLMLHVFYMHIKKSFLRQRKAKGDMAGHTKAWAVLGGGDAAQDIVQAAGV